MPIYVGSATSTSINQFSVGIGSTTTAGRNAGVGTALGSVIYNVSTDQLEMYGQTGWKPFRYNTIITGGTITNSPTSVIHTFTSSGTFNVQSAPPTFNIDYLVVGGGGGGGSGWPSYPGVGGGGGGAGGFRVGSGIPMTNGVYTIRVGDGGSSNGGYGATGQPSFISNPTVGFSSITSEGGGGGPGVQGGANPIQNGGSGSGGGSWTYYNAPGGLGNRVAGTDTPAPSQGNDGGAGSNSAGGGGGGASGAGGAASGTTGGPGGNGSPSSISGSPVTYSGGGGGGSPYSTGSGGNGGGGQGGISGTNPGTANRGGGGGGSSTGAAGSGGSGIVIVSYPIVF